MTEDPLKAIACSLHDGLMLLAPAGWTAVELEVVATAQGLKVASLESRGDGARAPSPQPRLGVVKEHEAAQLSEALDELSHLLTHDDKHWHGGVVRCERAADSADLKLLEGDRVVWLARLTRHELDQLLVTDALFDALLGTEPAFDLLQGALRVDDTASLKALGAYDPAQFVWRWNHADPDVRRVCGVETQPPGLSAFWRPVFACDEGFAWALCAHVCVTLGARGAYRLQDGETVKLGAVMR